MDKFLPSNVHAWCGVGVGGGGDIQYCRVTIKKTQASLYKNVSNIWRIM